MDYKITSNTALNFRPVPHSLSDQRFACLDMAFAHLTGGLDVSGLLLNGVQKLR